MSNGTGLGGHNSASQVAAIVPHPGSSTLYYIFTVDAIDNNLVGGLRYSIVDMSLQNGLGDIVSTAKSIRLPTPTLTGKVTEKLAVARHGNGKDFWVLVHGWGNRDFYSFLVSDAGIGSQPVVSSVGSVHEGGGSFFGAANAVGCMKVSPDGRRLALGKRDDQFELYDFNNVTGRVSNYIPLTSGYCYGVEFSPDNTRLYGSTGPGGAIVQFNLLAGSASAIASSRVIVASGGTVFGGIQLGPDKKIYISDYNSPALHRINNPNELSAACDFQRNAVFLGGNLSQNGLPNFPNAIAPAPTATVTASAVCLGAATTFQATVQNAPGATAAWNFGDPPSGTSNTATGLTATHVYSAAGTFTATLTLTVPGLAAPLVVTQAVTVYALPTVSLGAPRQLCVGQEVVLQAGAQPAGSTYRWQDGSTAPTFTARAAGTYTLTVTSPQGCAATGSVAVTALPAATVSLGRDTTLCLQSPLLLRPSAQPAGTTYRWQDGSTASTYEVLNPGTYSVTVTPPGSCSAQDDIVVRSAQCPFTIPNIITPNGDRSNETFVLKGLTPQAWELTVFNRWGQRVYEKSSYDNSWNATGQPDGVYFYLLRNPATAEQYRGWVQVSR
ncbi:T9SS type B sorting domain-containing protein [Hymenobacter weizhouensis]|uniref:T9SS type B sorting domain-containing protein n=1 Tax=Hymenobacter sp. YIM 151500-1 TaxID=2987689 RepID=UPI002226C171|nr:gliding motility-associated C-terminal domain-containing protein [Hymenobacter sp. YIM 151500-1]UYZ64516.1 gliding motility-associated C-terminal domain-containing protein [Hymenobacter sp. YIM 151500-1]